MYPELTIPLLALLLLAAVGLAWPAIRLPVVRRLAVRQVARRRTEGLLVMAGASLGAAIIIGSLVVGDTLAFSVRQVAYQTLGNIDERVVSSDAATGAAVAVRLLPLSRSPDVDGVLTARVQQAAASTGVGARSTAEPRVLAWDVDFATARTFGAAHGASGLTGPAPRPGHVVVNRSLADTLHLAAGTYLSVYVSGLPERYRVDRVIADDGLAGTGFGSTQNRDLFLPPGTLAYATGTTDATRWVTFVSNRGGVEGGNALTAKVTAQIRDALGSTAQRTLVQTP